MRSAEESNGELKRKNASRSRYAAAWAIVLSVPFAVASGCAGVVTGVPEHCIEEDEFIVSDTVDAQLIAITKPDENGQPTRFREIAIRLDYLEARCYGINAFRGE
jgi:hypothetical protein